MTAKESAAESAPGPAAPSETKGKGPVLSLALLACLAAVGLEAYPLARPMLLYDDLTIVLKSWTWQDTWANLWVPANEHTMPLGRLSTWALVQLAGPVTALPLAVTLQGPLALVAGMTLLYVFLRRELGHPFYGLVGMALFGVTAVYQQAVCWFAASFAILALDTILLALLAAQRWRRTAHLRYLLLSVVWVTLAPAWFAIGVLAGPLCVLYLAYGVWQGDRPVWPRLARTAVPLLGTVLFLAVSLYRNASQILHTPHYDDKTAVEAFHPLTGLWFTLRSLVDNLLFGLLGVGGVELPPVVAVVGFGVMTVAAAWWWRRAPARRLLLLGLGFILTSYFLIYAARAEWGYGRMTEFDFCRYHLLPQLGLTLFVCGGLMRWQKRWFHLPPSGQLTPRQVQVLAGLIAVLFGSQLPRSLLAPPRYEPEQIVVLRHLEEIDARCREQHISGDTAREVLVPQRLKIPACGVQENGWDLLRGSDAPRPIHLEEASQILNAP